MVNEVISQSKTEQEKSLDLELMLEELEGNRVLFFEIVERFLHRLKKQLITLREAIAAHNLESIVFAAHSIHGGASSLGMGKLAKVASHLEKINLTKNSSPEENYRVYEELNAELDSLEIYVSELLTKASN